MPAPPSSGPPSPLRRYPEGAQATNPPLVGVAGSVGPQCGAVAPRAQEEPDANYPWFRAPFPSSALPRGAQATDHPLVWVRLQRGP